MFASSSSSSSLRAGGVDPAARSVGPGRGPLHERRQLLRRRDRGGPACLDDGAGDGYFYDPERTDAEGAFFFHFAEVGYYIWFPSLRNFLSGVIECYRTQAIKVAADGKSLEEDFDRTEKVWSRFGKGRCLYKVAKCYQNGADR